MNSNFRSIHIPTIIPGGIFTDDQGSIHHVNDFRVEDFCRFYVIEHGDTEVLRAWQGHRGEVKAFYVVSGAFTINAIRIDDPDHPDRDAEPWVFRLSEKVSEVLILPARYANGFQATIPGSKMIVFSNLNLDESGKDIIRYPADYWGFFK